MSTKEGEVLSVACTDEHHTAAKGQMVIYDDGMEGSRLPTAMPEHCGTGGHLATGGNVNRRNNDAEKQSAHGSDSEQERTRGEAQATAPAEGEANSKHNVAAQPATTLTAAVGNGEAEALGTGTEKKPVGDTVAEVSEPMEAKITEVVDGTEHTGEAQVQPLMPPSHEGRTGVLYDRDSSAITAQGRDDLADQGRTQQLPEQSSQELLQRREEPRKESPEKPPESHEESTEKPREESCEESVEQQPNPPPEQPHMPSPPAQVPAHVPGVAAKPSRRTATTKSRIPVAPSSGKDWGLRLYQARCLDLGISRTLNQTQRDRFAAAFAANVSGCQCVTCVWARCPVAMCLGVRHHHPSFHMASWLCV